MNNNMFDSCDDRKTVVNVQRITGLARAAHLTFEQQICQIKAMGRELLHGFVGMCECVRSTLTHTKNVILQNTVFFGTPCISIMWR